MIFRRITAAFMAFAVTLTALFVGGAVFAASYNNMPEQIVCTPYGDLKTQVGLAWVTAKNGSAAYADVVPKSNGSFASAVRYMGTAADVDNWRSHKVVADGLTPNTTYQYRVGDGTNWSTTGEFTTAPDTEAPGSFTFLQVNDPQASSVSGYAVWSNALERAIAKFPNYKLIAHGGDHVNNGGSEDEWEMYFDSSQNIFTKSIFAGVTGNHDVLSGTRYADRFNYLMPTSATTAQGTYYSFDYGNAHFIVVNAQSLSDSLQPEWIKYDFVKNAKKWNIVLIHNPLYTNADHYAEVNVRNAFNTVLNDQLGVDIVFGGHDHIYNRTYPILSNEPITNSPVLTGQAVNGIPNVTLWNNPAGTVNQVNGVCGTKYYNLNSNYVSKWFWLVPLEGKAAYQPSRPVYAGVTVTDNELVNTAYYTDGSTDTLIESNGIRKDKPQVNPPKNVRRTFADNMMTLTWDAPEAQENQAVQRYVVYDENNAFTAKNKTYFINATANRSMTLAMNEAIYNNTNFVVKAIGQHSVSEIGTPEPTGSAVNGTVNTLVNWYADNPASDPAMTELHNQFGKAKVELYDESFTNVVKTAYAEAGNSAFSISGVADGSYYTKISRGGMCPKVLPVTVNGGNVNLGAIALEPTDTDGDMSVTVKDVLDVIAVYAKNSPAYPGADYRFYADTNGDGQVDLTDVLAVMNTYKQTN